MESKSAGYQAVIGMGSNLGSRQAYLQAGLALLRAEAGVEFLSVGRVYRTEAIGPAQPSYLNTAARVRCTLEPEELLKRLLAIERRLGRTRDVRWGPRVLDLDILWIDGQTVNSESLQVPHPELENRPFALAPLLDAHPILEGSFADALRRTGGAPTVGWEFQSSIEERGTDRLIGGMDPPDALAQGLNLIYGGDDRDVEIPESRRWNFLWSDLGSLIRDIHRTVELGFRPVFFVIEPSQKTANLVSFGRLWEPLKRAREFENVLLEHGESGTRVRFVCKTYPTP